MNNKATDCLYYIVKHADARVLNQCVFTCNTTIVFHFMHGITFIIECFENAFELYEMDGKVYCYGAYNTPAELWEKMCIEHGFLRGGEEKNE